MFYHLSSSSGPLHPYSLTFCPRTFLLFFFQNFVEHLLCASFYTVLFQSCSYLFPKFCKVDVIISILYVAYQRTYPQTKTGVFPSTPSPNLTGLYPTSLLLHSWAEVPTPDLSLLSHVPFILLSDLDIPSWP